MKTNKIYIFPEVAMEMRDDCISDSVYHNVMASATMALGRINTDAKLPNDNTKDVEFILVRQASNMVTLCVRSDKSPSLHALISHYWGIDLYIDKKGMVIRPGLVEDRMGHPYDN